MMGVSVSDEVQLPVAEPTRFQETKAALVATLEAAIGHFHCDAYGRWRRGGVEPHPKVRLRVQVCQGAYGQVDKRAPGSEKSGGGLS